MDTSHRNPFLVFIETSRAQLCSLRNFMNVVFVFNVLHSIFHTNNDSLFKLTWKPPNSI